MKVMQCFLMLTVFTSSGIYSSLTDGVDTSADSKTVALKTQESISTHSPSKRQQRLLAAQKIKDSFKAYKSKKQETAAQIIQKAGQGFLDRRFLLWDSTLKNMPYAEFKYLICSGDYINKTDWFYRYIENRENKQIFSRDKQGKIDLAMVVTIDPDLDFDALFHKYILDFHVLCYDRFIERAFHEIIDNKSSWSDAVSIMKDGQPLFPIVCKIHDDSNKDHDILILAQIFSRIYIKIFPQELNIEFFINTYINDSRLWQVLSYFYGIDSNEDYDAEQFKEESVYRYCQSLGEKLLSEEQESLSVDWVFAAQQTFQLGRFIFDNKVDALIKLGGQTWLNQQPREIIEIIEKRLKKTNPRMQANRGSKQTWKQKFLRWYGLDDVSVSDVLNSSQGKQEELSLYQG